MEQKKIKAQRIWLWATPGGISSSFLHVVVCWSLAKYQIPSTKLQWNPKFQYSITKTGLEFWNWGPGRVGSPSEARTILVIVICYSEFLVTLALQYFSTPRQLAIFTGKAIQPWLGSKNEVFGALMNWTGSCIVSCYRVASRWCNGEQNYRPLPLRD